MSGWMRHGRAVLYALCAGCMSVLILATCGWIGVDTQYLPTIGSASVASLQYDIFRFLLLFYPAALIVPILNIFALRHDNPNGTRLVTWWIATQVMIYVCLTGLGKILEQALMRDPFRGSDAGCMYPTVESTIRSTPVLLRPVFVPFIHMLDHDCGLSCILAYCSLWGLLLTAVLEVFIYLYRKRFSGGRNANESNS